MSMIYHMKKQIAEDVCYDPKYALKKSVNMWLFICIYVCFHEVTRTHMCTHIILKVLKTARGTHIRL